MSWCIIFQATKLGSLTDLKEWAVPTYTPQPPPDCPCIKSLPSAQMSSPTPSSWQSKFFVAEQIDTLLSKLLNNSLATHTTTTVAPNTPIQFLSIPPLLYQICTKHTNSVSIHITTAPKQFTCHPYHHCNKYTNCKSTVAKN